MSPAEKTAPVKTDATAPTTSVPLSAPATAEAKPAAKAPAKSVSAAKTPKAAKPAEKASTVVAKPVKEKKPKLVRDSFTMPKNEYVVIDELKQRAAGLARPAKKSELLRAGIKALAALDDTALLAALAHVPAIKTGRPKKD